MQSVTWSALVVASLALAMTAAGQTGTASLTFDDQTSDGTTVTVASVELPDDGFVVIYNGTTQSELLGHSELLPAGTHSNVSVDVQGLSGNTTVTAVLHQDSDGDGEFASDHFNATGSEASNGTDEGMLTTTDASYGVSESASIQVEAAPAGPVQNDTDETQGAEPAPDDETGEPGTDTPGLGLVALLAAVAAALIIRRRS